MTHAAVRNFNFVVRDFSNTPFVFFFLVGNLISVSILPCIQY